jgi:hypothetical protein
MRRSNLAGKIADDVGQSDRDIARGAPSPSARGRLSSGWREARRHCFPVTLYKQQWLKLLDMSAEIRAAERERQFLMDWPLRLAVGGEHICRPPGRRRHPGYGAVLEFLRVKRGKKCPLM